MMFFFSKQINNDVAMVYLSSSLKEKITMLRGLGRKKNNSKRINHKYNTTKQLNHNYVTTPGQRKYEAVRG